MIKYKKCFRRICAVLLALLVTVSALPAGTAYAAQNISKEEVVYVNLNADGSVSEVYVVNSFDLSSAGKIVDYGRYSAVRNMTTTDAVEYANDLTTIAAPAGKLYYEGTLDSKVLPWKFEFRYWLDGKEYTAGDLAGKSGKLEISMQVRENTACSGTFFSDYALQLSLSMDTHQAKHIAAEGATAANVGSDKQLTWTILPGKGADLTVTADVTDFEMSEISINGVRLSMDIDVDDQEIMDQIFDLQSGAIDLDDGAAELLDGVGELRRGVNEDLRSAVSELWGGARELQDGVDELSDGTDSLRGGVDELHSGTGELLDGVGELRDGVGCGNYCSRVRFAVWFDGYGCGRKGYERCGGGIA